MAQKGKGRSRDVESSAKTPPRNLRGGNRRHQSSLPFQPSEWPAHDAGACLDFEYFLKCLRKDKRKQGCSLEESLILNLFLQLLPILQMP